MSTSPNNNSVQFQVGNIYQRLPPSTAKLNRTGTYKKIHDWILYVDIISGNEDIIDKVSFDLGSTFQPRTFPCYYPIPITRSNNQRAWRFATRQQSYGNTGTNATIRIIGVGGSTLETTHTIHLSPTTSTRKSPIHEFRELKRKRNSKMNKFPDRQKIGIELELSSANDVDPEMVANCLGSSRNSSEVDVVRDYSAGREISGRWKLVPDSSIMCSPSQPDCNKFELVSPILTGPTGLQKIHHILNRMDQNITPKLRVNKSMGFHVHVDVDNLSGEQIVKVCQNFIKYESVMDTFMPHSRRSGSAESRYFKSNRASVSNAVVNNNVTATNRQCHDQLAKNNTINHLVSTMNTDGRYYKLNLTNLATGRQPTLEFRQHSATISYDKVSAWVRFCTAFVRNSARLASPTPFKEGRSLEFRFDALFRYVVKDRALCEFYRERREGLVGDDRMEEEDHRGCGCRDCGHGNGSGGGKRRRMKGGGECEGGYCQSVGH